jgi:hypothetical protein
MNVLYEEFVLALEDARRKGDTNRADILNIVWTTIVECFEPDKINDMNDLEFAISKANMKFKIFMEVTAESHQI